MHLTYMYVYIYTTGAKPLNSSRITCFFFTTVTPIICICHVAGMDCPRVRYPQFNDEVEADLAEHGYKVLADPSEQVRHDTDVA